MSDPRFFVILLFENAYVFDNCYRVNIKMVNGIPMLREFEVF